MRKYDFNETKANGISSIVYLISAVGSPFCGFVVDKTGMNIMWVFIAIFITLGSHALLAFTYVTPFIPMVRKDLKVDHPCIETVEVELFFLL